MSKAWGVVETIDKQQIKANKMLVFEENRSIRGKTSRSNEDNKQTAHTQEVETRMEMSECSQHCVNTASFTGLTFAWTVYQRRSVSHAPVRKYSRVTRVRTVYIFWVWFCQIPRVDKWMRSISTHVSHLARVEVDKSLVSLRDSHTQWSKSSYTGNCKDNFRHPPACDSLIKSVIFSIADSLFVCWLA